MLENNISPDDYVTVTEMGHIIEIQHMEKTNSKANIKKLCSEKYVDLSTGEIKDFDRSDNRSQSENSLRQTFKKLRYLINNNFLGSDNELHITLTYKENMTDNNRLYEDFRKFMQRLKYQFKNNSSIDYISVVEPQARGAWHCHLLIRFNDLDKIYIKNSELSDLWGHGFVTIKSLRTVDNIGAYLSAYLSDIELTDENTFETMEKGLKVEEKTVNGENKRIVKGGRLHLYPSGMNIFRKSKGCTYPDRVQIRYKDIKKIVGSAKPHYEAIKNIEVDDFTNTITYIQYNLKR